MHRDTHIRNTNFKDYNLTTLKLPPLNSALLNIPPKAQKLKITDSNTCTFYCLLYEGDLHFCVEYSEVNFARADFPFVHVNKQHLRECFLLAVKKVIRQGFLRETGVSVVRRERSLLLREDQYEFVNTDSFLSQR